MKTVVQLITYVDRFGGDFAGLKDLLDTTFRGLFGGVHILPFFDSIDGADAGFDPSDHLSVDKRLGDWPEVAALAANYSVMADIIVNHVSAKSCLVQDVIDNGKESDSWPLLLRKRDVFPDASSDADIGKIYRPRPGPPFTPVTLKDGTIHEFWTTFSDEQLDINVETAAGRAYLLSILDQFAAVGIREIRLDAAGYAIKRRGTRCFMLEETFDFIETVAKWAAKRGMRSIVEVHAHHSLQREIAEHGVRVYDFALPPLVLHAIYNAQSQPLKRWLNMAPRNCVTVLDTHDGIGIVDVAQDGERSGLLGNREVEQLVETIHAKTNGQSRSASGLAASNLDVYQVNTTFYDALGGSDAAYLIARAIQLFSPGIPQIYYVGLLAGKNDMELVRRTTVGRDINRHYFDKQEIEAAVSTPVVQGLFELIRLRNSSPAFSGRFSLPPCPDTEIRMAWEADSATIELVVDFLLCSGRIIEKIDGKSTTWILSDQFRRAM